MGIADRLAGDRAKAEALPRIIAGIGQAAIVEDEALALGIFEIELAIVSAGQRLADHALGFRPVEAGPREDGEMIVGHGELQDFGRRAQRAGRERSDRSDREGEGLSHPRLPRGQ